MKRMSYLEETGSEVLLRTTLRIDDIDQLRLSPTEGIRPVGAILTKKYDVPYTDET